MLPLRVDPMVCHRRSKSSRISSSTWICDRRFRNRSPITPQTTEPMQVVISMLPCSLGMGEANPAAAKAPSTRTTETRSRHEVSASQSRILETEWPMYTSDMGSTVPAPAMTVAIAKKNDRLLKAQKIRTSRLWPCGGCSQPPKVTLAMSAAPSRMALAASTNTCRSRYRLSTSSFNSGIVSSSLSRSRPTLVGFSMAICITVRPWMSSSVGRMMRSVARLVKGRTASAPPCTTAQCSGV
ncbi:hypothetical protein Mp_4g00740 [Marchantia polymorpha subsp. ruderalis]|uniref:Uncharacterized protein n=2 Tax=Marchantia polymorpha TaxID=3197 RepID=A0AAF6B4Y9_MARPO|nr:hypothetical protein MARPO_0066s0068 [Marchantia polymorpha]BBN07073.1 hypothetical protein Mp_4g00740 [Marchantia polymorpha subsp. ruderalis]|eukprot:PTQ36111.1 hypothetical protein MARPO_0066s0068 [Marchantia polymorpha]